ncbi:MAG: Cys-Gln thioester bond-forming surface protein [Clostridia bacterium]|nr:Cys-Gln thioester bond-forming surface protein [Clostridia bacterium]
MINIKKYIRKLLIINLLIVTIFSLISNSFAIEKGSKKVKFVEDCGIYLKYQGTEKLAHYAIFENNGKSYPAYCLNPEYDGVGTGDIVEYEVNVNKKIDDEKIWKVIINGYPYKSLKELGTENEKEAYTATQFAIYTVLHNRNPEDYSVVDDSVGAQRTYQAYLKIVNSAKESTENINENSEVKLICETENWNVDAENNLYKMYSIDSSVNEGVYKVSPSGADIEDLKIVDINGDEKSEFKLNEKFKILLPLEKLKNDLNFEININANLKTKPVLFGETTIPETQNYGLTGYMYEKNEIIKTEEIIKNTAKIEITKLDKSTGKKLEGVEFNLLNATQDTVIQKLVTDKNGKIILNKLEPGAYYLQEVKTLEGYNLNSNLIEIDLEYNEEFKITIENSKIEIPKVEIPKTETQTIKKLPVTGY